MKIYIASRLQRKREVEKLTALLRQNGHEIPFDWTRGKYGKSMKPYDKNIRLSKIVSKKEIDAVRKSDIFILISDGSGTGMYVELGAAILAHVEFGRPHIFVLGKHTSNTVFFFHPSIKRLITTSQLLKEINKTKIKE